MVHSITEAEASANRRVGNSARRVVMSSHARNRQSAEKPRSLTPGAQAGTRGPSEPDVQVVFQMFRESQRVVIPLHGEQFDRITVSVMDARRPFAGPCSSGTSCAHSALAAGPFVDSAAHDDGYVHASLLAIVDLLRTILGSAYLRRRIYLKRFNQKNFIFGASPGGSD